MNGISAAYNEASEFWEELTSTLREMFHNLASQSVGIQERNSYIDDLMAVSALIFFILIVFLVISHLLHMHRNHISKTHFDIILGSIHDEAEKTELKVLANKCVELGERIDEHISRKGFSKKISTLVFFIARQMNLDFTETVLFFCASLVHDAGYLDAPSELFCAEILFLKEKKVMKTHILRAINYIDFVPKKYIVTFMNAITYHHENMDGSGFPDGLCGEEIPLCARIIHVAEDYVFMTEKSDYNKPVDMEKALLRLKEKPEVYDEGIVNVLANVLKNTVI
ncbi:MAG: HD domain-containing protein [Treponema sp.]|nr:HD domain-containing protein [Treponema sp.]